MRTEATRDRVLQDRVRSTGPAARPPSSHNLHSLLKLQRTVGNHAVRRMLQTGPSPSISPQTSSTLAAGSSGLICQRLPSLALTIRRQPDAGEKTETGPGPAATGTGDVSVYVGQTMTSEAALREVYRKGARAISEEALAMIKPGTSVDDAARWAHAARNDLKVAIRARGSAVVRGLAEARNIKKYGDKIGPAYEQLIREGKTPHDIIGSAGKASTKVNRVAAKLKVGGRFLIALDLAIVTWEVFSAPEGERLKTAVKGGAGVAGAVGLGWAGAKGGAALGTTFGPVGTVVGGVLGGLGGALLGGWLGRKAGEEAYDFVEELVNPRSGSIWELQVSVIDAIEQEYIRGGAAPRP